MARSARKVTSRLTTELRTIGLSLDAWLVLNMLVTEGSKSMGELANLLALNIATVTKLIDRMVNDNLVYRKPHHEDRRVVQIFPADTGVIRHAAARKLVTKEQTYLETLIPELPRLMQHLIDLNRILEAQEEQHSSRPRQRAE